MTAVAIPTQPTPPPAPVAQRQDGDAIISMIERAARDPNVDVDKMVRLFDMHKEAEARRAILSFNTSMKEAQKEMEPVARRARNTQTNSSYATFEDVAAVITPIYTKHGFSLSFGTADSPHPNHYRIICEISHEHGDVRTRFADIPIDIAGMKGNQNKTATHAFGSTMSYGRRYLTLLIFNVATRDDKDGNRPNESGELITPEQATTIRNALKFAGADERRFLARIKLEAVEDILASKFDKALDVIKSFPRKEA